MRRNVSSGCFVALIFLMMACAPRTGEKENRDDEIHITEEGGLLLPSIDRRIELLRIDRRDIPGPVARWIDKNLQLAATGFTDTKEYGDTTYIFVASGERRTGGYEVSILDATRRADGDTIDVRVRFTRPPPDAMVTQVITYPYDVAAIRATDITVNILPEGNDRPSRLTRLQGLDSLREIKASSHTIKVFHPNPNTEVGRAIPLTGVALLPEGNVYYKLIDSDGQVKKIGGTLTASPLDWGYFETEITIPDDITDGSAFQLVVFRFDGAASRETDQVTIPLSIRKS